MAVLFPFRPRILCTVIIFVFILVRILNGSEISIYGDSKEIKSVEIYCPYSEESAPENCSPSFQLDNTTDKSSVIHLKLSGCSGDKVNQLIESYPNLHSLDVFGVKSLDSFQLKTKNLVKLNVFHNELTSIPSNFFAQTPNLAEIDLSYNNLTEIPVLPTNLVKINLSHNKISKLNAARLRLLTKLEFIDLSGNSIMNLIDLNSDDILRLKVLRLENNPINEINGIFHSGFAGLMENNVSISLSWKNIEFMQLNPHLHSTKPIRVVLNQNEGIFHTTDRKIELHCKEQSFENLINLEMFEQQIENPNDLMRCLTPSIRHLDAVKCNFTEQLNTKLLAPFTKLKQLLLHDVQLKEFDFSALKNFNDTESVEGDHGRSIFQNKEFTLDLSSNNQLKLSNTSFLRNFKFLFHLILSNCHIGNAPELIQNLSPSTITLDLSDNFVGKLNSTTFEKLYNLKWLSLRNTNLSFDDLKPFKPLGSYLEFFDISENGLENLDFATLEDDENIRMIFTDFDSFGSRLLTLNLSNNDLTEIKNFNRTRFYNPSLELDISRNRLSCEFVSRFVSRVNNEWPKLKFLNDPYSQKGGQYCGIVH